MSFASTISISTGSDWTVTPGGTGVAKATPFVMGNWISITSNGLRSGSFVGGGDVASFDNFWIAQFDFTLPSDATNIRLTYSDLAVDDRGVVLLNGNLFAAIGLGEAPSGCTPGAMVISNGSSNNPFDFCGGPSGVVTGGFNLGGTNTITAIINNTGTGIVGDLSAPFMGQDYTLFTMLGAVDFSETPEPGSGFLIPAGALALVGMRRYLRRSNAAA